MKEYEVLVCPLCDCFFQSEIAINPIVRDIIKKVDSFIICKDCFENFENFENPAELIKHKMAMN